jgi:hypothetical protein
MESTKPVEKNLVKGVEKFPPLRGLILANSGQGKTYWLTEYVISRLNK